MENENVANAEMQADFEKFYDMLLKLNEEQRKLVMEVLQSEESIEKKRMMLKNKKAR